MDASVAEPQVLPQMQEIRLEEEVIKVVVLFMVVGGLSLMFLLLGMDMLFKALPGDTLSHAAGRVAIGYLIIGLFVLGMLGVPLLCRNYGHIPDCDEEDCNGECKRDPNYWK